MFEAGDGRVTRASVLGVAPARGPTRRETGSGYPEVAQAFFGSADHHGIYNEPTFQSVLLRCCARARCALPVPPECAGLTADRIRRVRPHRDSRQNPCKDGRQQPDAGPATAARPLPSASSIGKKVVMAVTGLVLFGFVVAHMVGNLQVFLGPRRSTPTPSRCATIHGAALDRRGSACWWRWCLHIWAAYSLTHA